MLVVGVHWAMPARHRLWVLGGASVVFMHLGISLIYHFCWV